MATVTGYTAEKMKVIEDTTVVDGTISGDDLILVTRNGTPINAGNVRGPQGVPGPSGDAGSVELASPIGSITMFGGAAAPGGWLLCDGQSYVRTNYQALFDVIGIAFGSVDGTHFNVPNLQQKMPVGLSADPAFDAIGKIGGSKDLVVVDHAHPHTHTTAAAGNHHHVPNAYGSGIKYYATYIGTNQALVAVSGTGGVIAVDETDSGNHTHGLSTDQSRAGESGVGKNVPPYVVINFIIRF
jgi:microcystin-dependent protein